MTPTKVLLGQGCLVVSIVSGGLWASTQWTAAMLGNQPRLGAPLTTVLGQPVYAPWRLFEWWYAYEAYAPDVFRTAGMLAGGSGLAGTVVAIAGSLWRARQTKNVTTYGSARWAKFEDLKCAKLFAGHGVFLGKLGDIYLRHDGPEHVLAFAPTRSGKGVGLVIPTLLTWPHSTVIHDIKGENWQLTAGFRSTFSHCLLFNPADPKSARYNPLLEVRKGEWEVRDVQNIADILVDPEGALERRNHWEKTSHALLVGVILHVLYAEEEKTLARVASFLSDPSRSIERTLRVMMSTNHLGTDKEPHVHPVVASVAREGVFAALEKTTEYAGVNLIAGYGDLKASSTFSAKRVWYLHKDQLGSILRVSDATGKVEKSFWYDPWGKRIESEHNFEKDNLRPGEKLSDSWSRGFTGHEHLDAFALVHMNGRVFDPIRAVFLSADPIGINIYSSQGLNPYIYVSHRPFAAVDPTGYFDLVGGIIGGIIGGLTGGPGGLVAGFVIGGNEDVQEFVKENWREIVVIAATVAVASIPGVNVIALGMMAGAVGGGLSAALYGGSFSDVLEASFKGAIIGGISAGVGIGVATGNLEGFAAYAVNGVVSGASSSTNGGDFWTGFGIGLVNHGVAANLHSTAAYRNSPSLRIATAATLGGTISEVSGGKFANGALSSAFQATLYESTRMVQEREYRQLTSDEVHELYRIFGDNIDYDSVRVVKGRYMIFQSDNVTMSPDGNIYAGNAIESGGNYCRDYTKCLAGNLRGHFAHEATHVWQSQRGVNVLMRGLYLHTLGSVFSNPYRYDPSTDFSNMNIEQQGNAVQDLWYPGSP